MTHLIAMLVMFAVQFAAQPKPAPSPGAIAMLATESPTPATRATVEAALRDPDWSVRATAARVVWAAGLTDLTPVIADVLEHESNSIAAAEQIRALLVIEGEKGAALVQPLLSRTDASGHLVFAEWQARIAPQRLWDEFTGATAADRKNENAVAGIVRIAMRQHPHLRSEVLRGSLKAISAEAWTGLLRDRELDPVGDSAIFVEALHTSRAGTRLATLWYLVSVLSQGVDVPAAVFDAAATAPTPDDAWGAFGRELVGRTKEGGSYTGHGDLIRAEGARHRDFVRILFGSRVAAKEERNAAAAILGEETKWIPQTNRASKPKTSAVQMRIAHAPWPGFVRSLLAASDCRTGSSSQFGVIRLAYYSSGTPQSVGVDPGTPESCRAAVAVLGRLTVAERNHEVPATGGGVEWVVVPLDRESVECMDAPIGLPQRVGDAANEANRIEPPKKVRDVRPEYPRSTQSARIQGTVVVEAIISETGCVAAAHVKSGVDPSLDFAALRAISGWRFAPTLLNGSPVSVIMTVSSNFALR